MGHGPLINQTYEVIRGPTEAKTRAIEGNSGAAQSRTTTRSEDEVSEHKIRRIDGRVKELFFFNCLPDSTLSHEVIERWFSLRSTHTGPSGQQL